MSGTRRGPGRRRRAPWALPHREGREKNDDPSVVGNLRERIEAVTLMGESSLIGLNAKLIKNCREESAPAPLNRWRVPPSTLAEEGQMTTAPDLPVPVPAPGAAPALPVGPAKLGPGPRPALTVVSEPDRTGDV